MRKRARGLPFSSESAAGDEALRRAVELLLAQHEKDDDFLEVPAMEVAAREMARDQQDETSGGGPTAQTAADLTAVEKTSIGLYRLLQKLGEGGSLQSLKSDSGRIVQRAIE